MEGPLTLNNTQQQVGATEIQTHNLAHCRREDTKSKIWRHLFSFCCLYVWIVCGKGWGAALKARTRQSPRSAHTPRCISRLTQYTINHPHLPEKGRPSCCRMLTGLARCLYFKYKPLTKLRLFLGIYWSFCSRLWLLYASDKTRPSSHLVFQSR